MLGLEELKIKFFQLIILHIAVIVNEAINLFLVYLKST